MSSSNDINASTQTQPSQQSYLDSAKSTVSNAVNTVTGNNPSQQDQQNGTPAEPEPSGTYNQTVGSAKQSIGALTGNESLRRTGEEQNLQGQDEEAQRQVRDWGAGVEKRVKGKVGEVLAAGQPESGSGDPGQRLQETDERLKWKRLHDEGKTTQKGAEMDINKRWGDDPK